MFIKIERHRFNTDNIDCYWVDGIETAIAFSNQKVFRYQGDYAQQLDALLKTETLQPAEQSDDK